jgi:hypothetical protein
MTISVANVSTSTDTFGQWVSKTNVIADALTNKAVTADSNTTTGNAAITGTFSANAYFGNYISGGNTSGAANLSITSNVIFSQNVFYTGIRVSLGLAANVQINSGNSTFRVLTVNSAASNTLVVSKINTSDLSDISISAAGNGQFLVYSSANSYWYNTNAINFDANTSTVRVGNVISVGNSSVNVTINSTMVSVSGSAALLKVYYANNQQAFP